MHSPAPVHMHNGSPRPRTVHEQLETQKTNQYNLYIPTTLQHHSPCLQSTACCITSCTRLRLSSNIPHWELCIAGIGGDYPSIHSDLATLSAADSRLKLVHLRQNGGISANSNAALALATGEFIVLLDHDDTLAPNLLFEVATILQTQPDCDILYFDEDKLSADGDLRSNPWLKPSWSPDLMLSVNLLIHAVFRRALVEVVGRFDPAVDGAPIWTWPCVVVNARRIVHLPYVLYHWRQIPGSDRSTLPQSRGPLLRKYGHCVTTWIEQVMRMPQLNCWTIAPRMCASQGYSVLGNVDSLMNRAIGVYCPDYPDCPDRPT